MWQRVSCCRQGTVMERVRRPRLDSSQRARHCGLVGCGTVESAMATARLRLECQTAAAFGRCICLLDRAAVIVRYSLKTRRSPASTCRKVDPSNRPTASWRSLRSTVITCETLATESLGRPESRAGTRTLPGASNRRRLELRITTIRVWMRLRLKASAWTIKIGRWKPGAEPRGSSRSARHMVPRSITTRPRSAPGLVPAGGRDQERWARSHRGHPAVP